ncbi:uncharacterized protein PFL1_02929 [Pseudozyma flocculosa PF-1]|uniref:Uncharacterized protein n=2 Tax=Pseudozyma flocculosa TaxID=84751 RepID=A0A5C3F2T5_9BASI|nr:uncharacterized protein PFL1_02929 [Pseudozyma flocculosa PF-1]EPQ29709.1 hypothetical protein PFL1_02929 [Pseudozyma flocculosa PF-1]SPO38285.1 uncharacterized protein PSFLO_03762 [Pseudozyma flocculosa]
MASTSSTAYLLPLPDIHPARDTGSKIRTVGHVVALYGRSHTHSHSHSDDPNEGATEAILTYGGASLRVDLSLCIDGAGDGDQRGGWRNYRQQQQQQRHAASSGGGRVYPPNLKARVMCIGYLEQAPSTTVEQPSRDWEDTAHLAQRAPAPHPDHVLRALLIRELEHDFDIDLWAHAARLRSQFEWKRSTTASISVSVDAVKQQQQQQQPLSRDPRLGSTEAVERQPGQIPGHKETVEVIELSD